MIGSDRAVGRCSGGLMRSGGTGAGARRRVARRVAARLAVATAIVASAAALAVGDARAEWTQEAHDAARTGATIEEPVEPWTLAWTWNGPDEAGGVGGHAYDAPAAARTVTGGGLVYVPAGELGLYALELATGEERWAFAAAPVVATAAYGGGRVFVAGADGALYALDAATGASLGRYDAGSPLRHAVLLAHGMAFVPDEAGVLHAVDVGSMTEAWRYEAGAGAATAAAYSAAEDLVVFATDDLRVHAVDAASGAARWAAKPTPHEPGFPNELEGYWPVIAERHGVVFVRMRLAHDALWSGPGPGGRYPTDQEETRALLTDQPGLQNLFALRLSDGEPAFLPLVGYGGVEDLVDGAAYLNTGPVPIVRTWDDGTEVAYSFFRNGQGESPDGRWDSHLGEMVLDDATIAGLGPGELRFVRFVRNVVITDEQCPLTMAGSSIFHAHWGASESARITDRSPSLGLSYDAPVETARHPTTIRRMQACGDFDPVSHWTTCGLTLYDDGRYWDGPGFWVYWDVLDPPTPERGAYSEGLLPRYTYVSAGHVIVEGNGGELFVLRHSGAIADEPEDTLPPPDADADADGDGDADADGDGDADADGSPDADAPADDGSGCGCRANAARGGPATDAVAAILRGFVEGAP
jgi:hypothetical protein